VLEARPAYQPWPLWKDEQMTKTNTANSNSAIAVESTRDAKNTAPDAVLINLCTEIVTGHHKVSQISECDGKHTRANSAEIDQVVAAGRKGITQASRIVATTMAGLRSKASVLMLVPDDDLFASLASDVLAIV
jgi:hypothetical protein